jgi:hypothetical protein
MPLTITLAVFAFATIGNEVDGDLLTLIERTPLVVNGQPAARVEKDEEGNIIRLRLDGMRLTQDDFRAVGKITSLRWLSLRGTNVAGDDLDHLQNLHRLENVVLTATGVTDEAVAGIAAITSLRSVCLGNVPMTPEAVHRLKKLRPRLAIGYYQRRP